MAELTEKQKQFCREYVKDMNGTQAAIRAGYSEKTANRIASENLSKPDIQSYIAELTSKARKDERSAIASAEEVLSFLSETMRSTTVKETDRIRCAELLGKRYALYSDKVQVDGAVPVMFAGEDDLHD